MERKGFKSVQRDLFYAASPSRVPASTFSVTVGSTRSCPDASLPAARIHTVHTSIASARLRGCKHHTGDPISSDELLCHEPLLPLSPVRDDSHGFPLLLFIFVWKWCFPRIRRGVAFHGGDVGECRLPWCILLAPAQNRSPGSATQSHFHTTSPCLNSPGLSGQQPQEFLASNPGHLLTGLCRSDSAFHSWRPSLPLRGPE